MVQSRTEMYIKTLGHSEIYNILHCRTEFYGVVQSRTEL